MAILGFAASSYGDFLSVKKISKTKIVYKDKRMGKMMSQAMANPAATEITYVYKGKSMTYSDGKPQHLLDSENSRMVSFFPETKEYAITSFKNLAKEIENSGGKKISRHNQITKS